MNDLIPSNNYVERFHMDGDRKEINTFIGDFLKPSSFDKIFALTGRVVTPGVYFDFIGECKLKSNTFINLFIDHFCDLAAIDEAVKIGNRYNIENNMGLDVFREEDRRWRIKWEKERLERAWDIKHGKKPRKRNHN